MMITRELTIFLYFILAGMIGSIFFDFLRAIRHNRKNNTLMVALEDFLFWLLIGGLFLSFIYMLDAESIRLYMFVGMFLGACLYFLTFGKYIYKLLDFVCRYIGVIMGNIGKWSKGADNEKENEPA
ncbi:MAG: spore cortex biosynthesis protein YabQ [Clostridia bacterium]|nr:spore cortex biosynthesis protein YabQ [Clostridia bacterium]